MGWIDDNEPEYDWDAHDAAPHELTRPKRCSKCGSCEVAFDLKFGICKDCFTEVKNEQKK